MERKFNFEGFADESIVGFQLDRQGLKIRGGAHQNLYLKLCRFLCTKLDHVILATQVGSAQKEYLVQVIDGFRRDSVFRTVSDLIVP